MAINQVRPGVGVQGGGEGMGLGKGWSCAAAPPSLCHCTNAPALRSPPCLPLSRHLCDSVVEIVEINPVCLKPHNPRPQHPYDGVQIALIEEDVARLGEVVAAVHSTLFCMDDQGRVLTRIW
jgi:hypothetical protein